MSPLPPTLLALGLLLAPLVDARADGGSADLDASLPDASVGEGGSGRDQQEAEDRADKVPTACRTAADCERGFACEGGRCTYVGYRRAQGGCLGATAAFAPLLLLALATRRRR